ncbi:hypothetical protein D8674_023528 [Pyrus ussuriensis x Pyrus communis]|uniref:Uncharacterized protein n=1 Tax=Pyrus ussuriensis x Pyrus communis TaxID=2448454 RepID=A0A5N5H0D7_9ROSA|nr:hypothetical protein D8674_023528 [Pyrus ussuriensis x Pyrus communis]
MEIAKNVSCDFGGQDCTAGEKKEVKAVQGSPSRLRLEEKEEEKAVIFAVVLRVPIIVHFAGISIDSSPM